MASRGGSKAKARTFRIKRVYDALEDGDGLRVLVDRLWPRGLSKAKAHVDLWLKDLAPSEDLRHKFHDSDIGWREFANGYKRELAQEPAASAVQTLLQRREKTITLLYASKDEEHNNALVLAAWLQKR
ncbi:MAG TPA: DUF488 family protein [Micropepsaceae bacterium]|jgi:uncharacterized protein YeaO (DUF488 family)|nr:DUF488 family protein [Micropepsaceae bacterium]